MKIKIIYESPFGNGKRVIDELTRILKSKDQDVESFAVNETSPKEIPPADLYIFSSPTRKFTLPPDISNFIDNFIPPKNDVKYALMTTYMDPRTIALKKMTAKLDEKKMKKATKDFKVKVTGLKGPIKEDYLGRLLVFSEELIKISVISK